MRRQENFDIANIGSFHGDRLPTHSFSQTCVPNFFTPSTYRSRFSQPAYAQQKIQRLDSINNNNNWMYFQDIPKNFNFGAYAQSLTDIGFTFDPVSMLDLQYVGDTPSEALQRLRKLPVVISDCKESLIILNHCILMDHVGGEKYNHIIQKFFNGKISFSINFPIVDSTSYQQYQYNLLENKQGLGELTVGDQVYLLGRAIGYGVKPTSESNAYNLVVVGYNDNGEPLFKGFRSHDNRVFTYQVMINHFDKVMRRPLTIGDVYHLVIKVASSPNDRPDFSPLTWQEIFNTFDAKAKLEMSSIVEQYEKFSGNTMARYLERKKATTVCVPESLLAQPALGLVQVERFNEAAFVAMCQPGDAPSENASHNTVRVSAPAAMHKPADDDFQDESYQVDHDFQLELYSVFKRFCSNVIRQSRQSFDGLFVYGDAGTGKTHLSQTAVAWLKSKGLKVLEFTFSQSPLSEDFYIKLLESSVKANGLYDETPDVMAYLETHYNLSQHDIIYIDDANKKLSKLSTVTKALLHYASQQGKIILVNSNQSPEEMLPSSFTERVSRIRFHEVRGSDYRQSQAWYKQVDVERLQSSDGEKAFIMNENLIATEPQMTIKFWVEKLM